MGRGMEKVENHCDSMMESVRFVKSELKVLHHRRRQVAFGP